MALSSIGSGVEFTSTQELSPRIDLGRENPFLLRVPVGGTLPIPAFSLGAKGWLLSLPSESLQSIQDPGLGFRS